MANDKKETMMPTWSSLVRTRLSTSKRTIFWSVVLIAYVSLAVLLWAHQKIDAGEFFRLLMR